MRLELLAAFVITCASTDCGPSVASPSRSHVEVESQEPDGEPSADLHLPSSLAALVDTMIAHGFGDARRGEYRHVTLTVGDVWSGEPRAVETRGWVIGRSRTAIAWNGIVYPVSEIGERADLATDLRALASAPPPDAPGWVFDEPTAIDPASPLLVKVPLLLRLGHQDAARSLLRARLSVTGDPLSDTAPFFGTLVTQWAWALFDRAICAHMRGDDAVALALARTISSERAWLQSVPGAQIDFLATAAELLDEQERRASASPGRRFDEARVRAIADPTRRIRALIADLDLVSARQNGQPGGVELAGDPIVRALVGAGEAAVEPLIAVLESDARLTRSVHFWRDFAPARMLIGVHEAAYVALATILEQDFFRIASTGDSLSARGPSGRAELARRVRAYWEQHRSIPIHERWYTTLRDDAAGVEQWLAAVNNITRPVDQNVQRGSMFSTGAVTEPVRPQGSRPAMRGEPLRSHPAPSVTALISQRLTSSLRDPTTHGAPCLFARGLVAWDAGSARTVLRSSGRQIAARLPAQNTGGMGMQACFSELAVAMAAAGEESGLDLWVAHMRSYRWGHLDDAWELESVLRPLWERRTHAAVNAVGEELFGQENGRLAAFDRRDDTTGRGFDRTRLLETPLVTVPAVRRALVRSLADTAVLGRFVVTENSSFRVRDVESETNSWMAGTEANPIDLPQVGTEEAFRRADYYAWKLSRLPNAPAFRPYWPLARRDRAIAEMVRYLRAPAP